MDNLNLVNETQNNTVNKHSIIDYKNALKTTVKFHKNKNVPFHRWYPFVEGFSEDFITNILSEVQFKEIKCLEPFCGSGTAPLTLQKRNIQCYSYEVSPFMYLISRVKLRTDYTKSGYEKAYDELTKGINEALSMGEGLLKPPSMSSLIEETSRRDKWVFHKSVMNGILDIKYAIAKIKDKKYRDLFNIALASILLEVSNVYRNGKCVSYKKDWQDKIYKRSEVHDLFNNQLIEKFTPDINSLIHNKSSQGELFSNARYCYKGDVREKIDACPNNYFNLVITSPPYLNSRDYTDAYMIELWMLDLVSKYSHVRKLRKKTIRSHVQVKWESEGILDIEILKKSFNEILNFKNSFWNESIPDMIIGYFNDMNQLFEKFGNKIVKGGKIYFNVANSAYYGIPINTDEIIAEIAELNGFKVNEIRVARHIPPSSQQKETIDYLRESVIVLTRI